MNKIDKKYKQAAEFPTKTRLYLANKALIAYMHSYSSQKTKDDLLSWWPELYYQYGNDDSYVLFRGMCFLKKEANLYYNLLSKIASTNKITSKTIRSWTANLDTGYQFAYYFEQSKKPLFERNRVIASVVLSAACYEGEGLDIRDSRKVGSNFAINEYEVIMPPSTMSCVIDSAVFLGANDVIYAYSEYDSDSFKELLKNLERLNRASAPRLVRVKTIKEYLNAFYRDIL